MAHHVTKEGIQPSKEKLKAVAEFTPSQTYTETQSFLGLVGHYRWFIKGFAHIAHPLHEHLSGEGASKKNKWVMLMENALGAFNTLRKACLKAPVLAFADLNQPFLLVTDTSKLGHGSVLSQNQTDGLYHPVAYASWSLNVHECNYHSTKYLLWKPFIAKTDNNPLTYIMTTPNLDATGHHWAESLVGFIFSIEYHNWLDNAAADVLSWVTLKLDAETMKSILNGVTMGTIGRVDAHDPVVAEADEEIYKQVWETAVQVRATHTCVNLHVTDWMATQQ